jgi:hypothetical protein
LPEQFHLVRSRHVRGSGPSGERTATATHKQSLAAPSLLVRAHLIYLGDHLHSSAQVIIPATPCNANRPTDNYTTDFLAPCWTFYNFECTKSAETAYFITDMIHYCKLHRPDLWVTCDAADHLVTMIQYTSKSGPASTYTIFPIKLDSGRTSHERCIMLKDQPVKPAKQAKQTHVPMHNTTGYFLSPMCTTLLAVLACPNSTKCFTSKNLCTHLIAIVIRPATRLLLLISM